MHSHTFEDFYVLPIRIPPLPSFPKPDVVHHLYLRRNAPKIPTAEDSRSLFVANVPVDSTEPHFRALFSSLVGAGRFESISFGDDRRAATLDHLTEAQPEHALRLPAPQSAGRKRKRGAGDEEVNSQGQQKRNELDAARLPSTWTRPLRRSGSAAVVMLADDKSVEQVLRAIGKVHNSRKLPTWGERLGPSAVPPLGSAWLRAHTQLSYPDRGVVQAAVDAFSVVFSRREREAVEAARRLRNEPDDDGFVTVTRRGGGGGGGGAGGGRTAPASRAEAEEARQRMAEREERKKQELHNFYRFQLRERRKAEQAELVRQFDEDRKKVAAMREQKTKFKPEE